MPSIAEDWIALHELVTRYSRALDTKDYQLLRTIWAPEFHGVYDMSSAGVPGALLTYNSGEELCTDVQSIHVPLLHIMHRNTNHWFDIDGDRATGRVYLDMFQMKMKDGRPETVHHLGWYNDVYVRLDGRWFITERNFTSKWTEGHWLGERPTLEKEPGLSSGNT
jgi:hypothetical protein